MIFFEKSGAKWSLSMNDVAVPNTVNSCKIFSSDSVQRLNYEFEEIAKRSHRSEISSAMKEGIEKGIEKNCIENAVSLMKNGASLDLIIKSLGISKEKLLELAKKNNIAIKG